MPFLLAVALAQAAAPPSQPSHAPDVVVTARKPATEAEARRLTRAITRVEQEQVARFPDPVCPASFGMPLDFDARLAQRIRDDAAAAGVAVASAGCRPNITVLIVSSGQKMVREIERTRAWMFASLDKSTVDRLLADKGPAHAWTITEIRSRDGDRLRAGSMMEDVPELQVRDASILHLPTRQDINGAVLLLDVDAVIGRTVKQLADYAAMRTLAQTRPAGASGDTILTLFDVDPASAPRALTAFDAGYLKALYAGPATDTAMTKTGRIAREIGRGTGK